MFFYKYKAQKVVIVSLFISLFCLFFSGCFDSSNNTNNSNSDNLENPLANKQHTTDKSNKPNIIIFYVDDLGYGDVGAYGASRVNTPNVDALAKNGIRFTDAHSSSSIGKLSRYSLLTGEYAFRSKSPSLQTLLQSSLHTHHQQNTALIIPTNKPTLPKMLKKVGYTTGVVGKWHLGLGDEGIPSDWNGEVSPGPLDVGFDYSFLIPNSADIVPSVYLENQHVLNLNAADKLEVNDTNIIGNRPTGNKNPEILHQIADKNHNNTIINGISRRGFMRGGQSAEFKDEDFYQVFTNMANFYIEDNKNNPFFLLFSFNDIHVPRLPNNKFKGVSKMGVRGDAIAQMDWITGQIVNKLKETNLLKKTLIIFTSDNGPVLNDGYEDGAVEMLGSHKPSGMYRGGKYSAFEGGTRVPTIVHYPNKVKAGTSNALMSQIDIYASLANLVGVELENTEAIDSENHLTAWFNEPDNEESPNIKFNGRTELIAESYTLSLRSGKWKYIAPLSKTNHNENESVISNNLKNRNYDWIKSDKKIESGLLFIPQLYNLDEDVSEKNNISTLRAEELDLIKIQLDKIINSPFRKK